MNSSKRGVGFAFASIAALACAVDAQKPDAGKTSIRATYTLPPLALSKLQSGIANDRKFELGGVGSDLWHGPGDAPNEFWMVTDRGPNGQIKVGDETRRTFPVPEFTPHILHVRADGSALTLLDKLPLVGASGKPVTGLPNVAKHDEKPWDASGEKELAYNASGLDTEGLVRTKSGEFWLSEEYAPSLVHVASNGKVLARFVPAGYELPGADYPVSAVLPAIFGKRKTNRGFEGLALSRDEKTLFLLLQSPLSVPDKKTGEASRQSRILAFDVASKKPIAEYVYRIEVAADVDPKAKDKQDEMKLSGIVALDDKHLLVLERTDELAKLFTVELDAAANVLGKSWDDPATTPSLEALPDPAAAGVKTLAKKLAVDLAAVAQLPGKLEGVAVLDAQTIALANDNDFDVGKIDEAGNNVGKGVKSQLFVLQLATPLP